MRVFLRLRLENSVYIQFFVMCLGVMFTALSLGCVSNVMIVRDGCKVISELIVNTDCSVLFILESWHAYDWLKRRWQYHTLIRGTMYI